MALSHLLRPKSAFRIFRVGFLSVSTRCLLLSELKEESGVKETGGMLVEQVLERFSEKKPTFISHKETKSTSLADLFRVHQDGLTETQVDSKSKEALSDILWVCHDKHAKTDFECSSHPKDPSPTEPTSDSQDGQCMGYEGGQTSTLSDTMDKELDFKEWYRNSANNQAASEIDKQKRRYIPVIKELIDFMRVEKPSKHTSSVCNNVGPVKENSSNGSNMHIPDDNDPFALGDFVDEASETEDEEKSSSDFESIDLTDAEVSSGVLLPKKNEDGRPLEAAGFSGTDSGEHRALVRFLHTSLSENQILEYFSSCGQILDAKFSDGTTSYYRSAYIYFRTREELTKALKKSGLCLGYWSLVVESADSQSKMKIRIPSLMGDPCAPAALIKNPTRTIKIEKLTNKISSCHIEEALAFCGSNVSGYFLGLSPTVAYVEFETEAGKERALAEQSINVLGRDLVMQRIDTPRTTVVRISSTRTIKTSIIRSVCQSHGGVRLCADRGFCITDVHFDIEEWPNMLKILNSLNGLEIQGIRVQAAPAPVYQPDVLLALWHQSEGRKHLKATMQVLLRKFNEGTLETSEIASLQALFVDKI